MERPDPDAVWRAIDIYLAHAYDGPPPPPVAARLESLRAAAADQFYDCPSFEHRSDAGADRVSLRLGNRRYPHMKLVIERASGRSVYCFFADTHDEHAAPRLQDAGDLGERLTRFGHVVQHEHQRRRVEPLVEL